MDNLHRVVKNRTVCIVDYGKSLEQLEDNIEKFRDKDFCWVTTSSFNILEKNILSKIGKEVDIVFDIDVPKKDILEEYETKVRIPRIEDFVKREKDNCWITSLAVEEVSIQKYKSELKHFRNRIELINDIVPEEKFEQFVSTNNLIVMIGCMLFARADRIILFGFDGFEGEDEQEHDFLYKADEVEEERLKFSGSKRIPNIKRITQNFKSSFTNRLNLYRLFFNNMAEVDNCSPGTTIDVIPLIDFDDI